MRQTRPVSQLKKAVTGLPTSLKFIDKCLDMVQSHSSFDKLFHCIDLWIVFEERVRKDSIRLAMTQTADPKPAPSERLQNWGTQTAV